jgi:hypothetical protein
VLGIDAAKPAFDFPTRHMAVKIFSPGEKIAAHKVVSDPNLSPGRHHGPLEGGRGSSYGLTVFVMAPLLEVDLDRHRSGGCGIGRQTGRADKSSSHNRGDAA